MLLFFTLLTYFHGEFSLSKAQLSDLNVCVCVCVCWNNLYRKRFHFHKWESVRVFINGINCICYSKLITAKFFKHLISSNVALRRVFLLLHCV